MAGLPAWLVLVRGVEDGAMLSFLGALAFAPLVLPRQFAAVLAAPLRRLAQISGILALVAGVAWLLGTAGIVTGSHGLTATVAAVPSFVEYARFAQMLLVRLVLIAVGLALLCWPSSALSLAALATALQPFLGHAGQVGGGLVISEIIHLLAAGAWLGGLGPLLIGLCLLPAPDTALMLRRFTPLGLTAVLLIAGTGIIQALVLAGGVRGLLHSSYGHVALLKAALFLLAIGIAATNRLILTPRITRKPAPVLLGAFVAIEALVGAVIVLVAGWLANLPPV